MIFWINDALFAKGASHEVDRIALLRNALTRNHSLFVSNDSHLPFFHIPPSSQPHFAAWRDSLHDSLRREVEHMVVSLGRISSNAVTRGTDRVYVCGLSRTKSPNGLWVGLSEGVRLAALPLVCMLENVVNDAAFLLRCMPPKWREQLEQWIKDGLLRFGHGGGVSDMTVMVDNFGCKPEWRLTHVLVFDHDGAKPSHPGDNSQRLLNLLIQRNMVQRSHMLQRKKQENYLPPDALHAINDKKHAGKAGELRKYLSFEASERHFKELRGKTFKNGFTEELEWKDGWFEQDGCWPEMRSIAEKLAAAM